MVTMTMLMFKFIKPPKNLSPLSCSPSNHVCLYGFWWANKAPFLFQKNEYLKTLEMGRYRMIMIQDGNIGPVMLEKKFSSSH